MTDKIEEVERALNETVTLAERAVEEELDRVRREAQEDGYREGWEAKDIDTERRERESFERGVAAERAAVLAWWHSEESSTELHGFYEEIRDGLHHPKHSDALDRVREQVRAETLAAYELDILAQELEEARAEIARLRGE